MDEIELLYTLSRTNLLLKATNASTEGITISTMAEEDRPLIYVNEGFERITGYSRKEVVGKNCRFLQGEKTNSDTVKQIRDAIRKEESCTVELLNYTKAGKPFWNRLSITPIFNEENKLTHYVGVQSDITKAKKNRRRLEEMNVDIRKFQDSITLELEQAKMVQQFILPSTLPSTDKIKFASLFKPMTEIGGDYFDVISLADKKYGMFIADVTGHGIPAALLTFMLSTTFKDLSKDSVSPAHTISKMNERLYQKLPDDSFVTMFYAIYDAKTSILTFAQAGHPDGYILRKSTNEVIPLNAHGTIVGAFSNNEASFSENQISLVEGDKFLIYTDAIMDIIDNHNREHSTLQLPELLKAFIDFPLEKIFEQLYDYGLHCTDLNKYPDDFSMLGMEIKS